MLKIFGEVFLVDVSACPARPVMTNSSFKLYGNGVCASCAPAADTWAALQQV